MAEDEDTVMGEAGFHAANPDLSNRSTSDGASQPRSHSHLNGGSDPYLAPPLLSQPMQMPVIQTGNSQPLETTILGGKQSESPPKSVLQSTAPADASNTDIEKQDSLVEEDSDWSDEEVQVQPGLPLASLPSGLCYDVQMRYHCEVRPTSDVHPEDPRRIYYIFKELCRAGLVDDAESTRPLVARPLKRINARNATEEEISSVHTAAHYAFVESTKGMPFAWC